MGLDRPILHNTTHGVGSGLGANLGTYIKSGDSSQYYLLFPTPRVTCKKIMKRKMGKRGWKSRVYAASLENEENGMSIIPKAPIF